MVDYILQNKEWIFSGVGITLAGLLYSSFFSKKTEKEDEISIAKILAKNKTTNTTTSNNSSANNHVTVNVNHDKETKHVKNVEPSLNNPESSKSTQEEQEKRKKLTYILFIDDDTKFKIIKILQNSGWQNTSIVKDLDNLDSDNVIKAHILFIDIQGVGVKLGFKDEGLGLALRLKTKYPDKKIVIYSTESKGDRFHQALRSVDSFLSKNAEPFEFLELIDQFSAEIKGL